MNKDELIRKRNLLIKKYENKLNKLVQSYWWELEEPKVSVEDNTSIPNSITVTIEDDRIKISASTRFKWNIEHKGYFSAVDYFPTLLPKVFWSLDANGLYEYSNHLENQLSKNTLECVEELDYNYEELDYNYDECDECWTRYYNHHNLKDELRYVLELKKIQRTIESLYWKIYHKEGDKNEKINNSTNSNNTNDSIKESISTSNTAIQR